MDDSDKPTLETEGLEKKDDGWAMPEPVFRTSEGTPVGKEAVDHDPEKDIPTETADAPSPEAPSDPAKQSVRVGAERVNRHKKKKRGCARLFTGIAVLIGLIVGSAVVALVYFLFYYRTPGSTF